MRKKFVALVGALLPMALLAAPSVPKLAVVISVDQMRADYLVRFRPYFVDGGFRRMLEQGAYFENNFYRHGYTKTAPGHATIMSGVNADVHGVIGNDWLDPQSFESGNSVEDTTTPLVGLPARTGRYANARQAAKAGRSPRNFLGTTVGDRLKLRYGAEAKVFGLADKDRSAILMSGAKADGAYWGEDGVFVTSTYYRTSLPAWVKRFNEEHAPETFFGRVWDRLLDPSIYDRVQGPDDAVAEHVGSGYTRTFPKRVDGGKSTVTESFFWALDLAPWNNDLVAGMARRLIEEENLGADAIPDMLCLGFSQTDRIGHSYGPDSHEVMDSYLRLDRTLADFFDYLDRRIGLQNCVIVLTADHGVCPIPEQTQQKQGEDAAGRVRPGKIDAHLNTALDAAFGGLPEDVYWAVRDGGSYRLNPRALSAKGLNADQVAAVARDALLLFPGVAYSWTRAELLGSASLGEIGDRMKLSFHRERSGDVVYVTKPYWIGTTISDHGTPYDYDSHVPQLWLGGPVQPGVRSERVATEDIAPTMAGLLGVELPDAKGQRVIERK